VQSSLLEEEGTKKVNAFDWETEFADVFKQGGFDVVIGNPPWGASFSSAEEQYLVSKYLSGCKKSLDSYALFIEAATQKLSDSGLLSFITPDTFLRKNGYKAVREMFFRYTVKQLIETGPLFSKVRDTWCLVFVISKHKPSKNSKIEHKKISRFVVSAEDRLKRFANSEWDYESSIEQDIWMKKSDLVVGYYADKKLQELINKIESHRKLSDLFDSYLISRGEEGSKFSLNRDKDGDYIMLTPENVNRYWISNGVTVQSNSLAPNKQNTYYSHPKIWLIRIQKMRWKQRIVCSYDDSKNSAGMKTLQIIISTDDDRESLLYLQGILSSKLINFWCINYLADDLNQTYLEQIPVPMIKSADKNQKEYHDKLVALVEHMLVLYKKMSTVKTPHEQEQIKRQIAATDIEIDNAVFELYGLSEEERNLVVSSTFNVD
jgi:predicted RNA methylase